MLSLKIYDYSNILKSMLENELKYSNSENFRKYCEYSFDAKKIHYSTSYFLGCFKVTCQFRKYMHPHTHTHILYTRIQLYTSFKVNSQTIVNPWHGIMWFGPCNYHIVIDHNVNFFFQIYLIIKQYTWN